MLRRRTESFCLSAAAAALTSLISGPATGQLTRVIAEDTVPPGYETALNSIQSLDGAANGWFAVHTENLIPPDFITTFVPTERDRFFGGPPSSNAAIFKEDEATVLGRFQRALGSVRVNSAFDFAYLSAPGNDDINLGVPDDGVFFRSAGGMDYFFGAEVEPVNAGFPLPGATDWRTLGVVDVDDAGGVYVSATYETTFTATINAPGTSSDGQSGTRFDQGLLRWDPVANTVDPILLTGDTLDFGPDPDQTLLWAQIQRTGSSVRTDVSSLGNFDVAGSGASLRTIAVADINDLARTGPFIADGSHFTNQLLIDSTAARLSDGTLVQTDVLVPVAFGGDGSIAVFEGINDTAINVLGDWATVLSIGDPNANNGDDPTATQALILNGELEYQLGDIVDDITLDTQFNSVALNDDGDLAFIHGETLFVNGEAVVRVGDEIEGGGTIAGLGTSFTISDRQANDELILHFLARDDSDPASGVLGDDVYRLIISAGICGDYNGSGQVEQGDLDLVLQNWGQDTTGNTPPGWVSNLPNGVVDQEELDKVLQNWGATAAPDFAGATVPEPAIGAIFAVFAGLGLTRRRNRG